MNFLIVGNLGYIGPLLVNYIRKALPSAYIAGFDAGYFSHISTSRERSYDTYLDFQYFGDVRKFPHSILSKFDSVIYLAAVSNDPMGEEFDEATYEINSNAIAKPSKHKNNLFVRS